MSIVDTLDAGFAALDAAGLRRQRRRVDRRKGVEIHVDGRPVLNFCSNDYLGLADHPALVEAAIEGAKRWGVGSGAAHLVSGHFAPHEAAEQALARFVGCEAALLFSTGYMVNAGVLSALVGRGDAIFADKLNHASLVDGALLTRADLRRYPHCDMAALERLLEQSTAARKLIVTDSVFSMDGDLAPLRELLALAERYDTWLMIDDAHGFGVLGPQGRGALASLGMAAERILLVGTLGKAAGVAGAFVAGSARVVEWLMQKTRTYLFTTGAPPLLAHCLLIALELIADGDTRREQLRANIARLRAGVAGRFQLAASATAIQPLIVGRNELAVTLANKLFDQGIWVPAIRPPTVPEGTARLRVSLSAAHEPAQVDTLVAALLQHAP